jgi:hypothetical protein
MSGAIVDYGTLVTAITDFAARNNALWTANIPLFIQYAHTELMRDLRIPLLQASTEFEVSEEAVAVPSDFRAVVSLYFDDDFANPLRPASPDQRLVIKARERGQRPRVFSREAANLTFAPAPSATYTAVMLYSISLPSLNGDLDTNDLLVRYPFAYMFGALAAAAKFDKFVEEEAKYEALFRNQIATINQAEMLDSLNGGPLSSYNPGTVV